MSASANMTPELLMSQILYAWPEVVIAGGALAIVLIGAFLGDKQARTVTYLCVGTLITAGFLAVFYAPAEQVIIFSGSYASDKFGAYAKLIIALTAGASLLLSVDYLAEKKLERPEFPVLALLSTLGMFIMVSAHDLIALYIGVEMQSLCLYVLAAYARDDAKSSEAGLKYFVLGALSSGLLLYGCSLVYGFTGSVKFDVIASQIEANRSIGVMFGMVFVLCGLAFKMSAAPFHMWTPDVYEGAPTVSTAFFASAPKVAASVLFARVPCSKPISNACWPIHRLPIWATPWSPLHRGPYSDPRHFWSLSPFTPLHLWACLALCCRCATIMVIGLRRLMRSLACRKPIHCSPVP
jgi:NADH-quinone oxidoreductase subunit N